MMTSVEVVDFISKTTLSCYNDWYADDGYRVSDKQNSSLFRHRYITLQRYENDRKKNGFLWR